MYSLFKTRSREPRSYVQLLPGIFPVPSIYLPSHSPPQLLIISEWGVDGTTVTTSKVMYAIVCIACFEGKGLLIAILRPVDSVHIGQPQSRRCSAANRNSVRRRKFHPGLSLFVVIKAHLRPSRGQAYQKLHSPTMYL